MPRPLTRAQALENDAFLKALRRSGNIRLAARETGMAYGTVQHRRAHHPAFAQRVDAALAFAQARLSGAGRRGPTAKPRAADAHRTQGGEPVIVRRNDGKLQMRRAQPGKLTRECEQAFLTALSATANVSLAAAAAGAAEAAFYRRRRQNPGFAREMKLALQTGYDRIELALLEGFLPGAHADDAWRHHNDPPPIPKMSPAQALQLLYLHQKEARLLAEPDAMRHRRGEPTAIWQMRMILMHEARVEASREEFRVAEAARAADRCPPSPHEPPAPVLPALDQVGGWSKAKAKPHAASKAGDETANARPASAAPTTDDTGFVRGRIERHPDRALFGGWRLKSRYD